MSDEKSGFEPAVERAVVPHQQHRAPSDDESAVRLVRASILHDALVIGGVFLVLFTLLTLFGRARSNRVLMILLIVALFVPTWTYIFRGEKPPENQAEKLGSPELVRGLLNLMHRCQTNLVRDRAARLMVAALEGVRSKDELHLHEWQTVVAVAGARKKYSLHAINAIGRLKVVEVLPDIRRTAEAMQEQGWKYEAKLTKAFERVATNMEAVKPLTGHAAEPHSPETFGWPDRDLAWFWKGIRTRVLMHVARLAMSLWAGTLLALGMISPGWPFEIVLAVIVILFATIMNRTLAWGYQHDRTLFPTDNVPATIFLAALRTCNAAGRPGRWHPLWRYLPEMADGACDFTSFTEDDWRFLLDRMEDLPANIADPISEALGSQGPVSLLPEVERRLPAWIASKAKSAPKVIARFTRARLLLRSRMIVGAAPAPEGRC
ncbi:MAG: hypothetical protein LCH41_10640 [Armatimonadetes bacterium]|nr:hypothetical protein [Armatimonadota bacterium]